MKKIISFFVSTLLIAVMAVSLTGCSGEIEQGSKIQRMNMVIEYLDAESNTLVEKTVQLKLYLNHAPQTTAHFMELAESGYYNGVCISNVQSSWLEFGGYTYADDKFTAKEYTGETLKGEFAKNGWTGNPLTTTLGSLIMKHDYPSDEDKTHVYDTAKATVIITLGSVSTFESSKYCVFGMVCNENSEANANNDGSYKEVVDKTSIDIVSDLVDYNEKDGVRTYYYEKDGKFYSSKFDEDENKTLYYNGTEINEANLIEGTELETFNDNFDKNRNYFLLVPYTKIVIKSITKI